MSNKPIKFRLAAYTGPAGKWNETAPKKGNEDDLFVDAALGNETQGQFIADRMETLSEAGCLMVVADGMGGMNAGEVASAIAIETVQEAFKKDNLTSEVLDSAKARTKYLEKVIVDADAAIKKRSRTDKECEGMGSTLILAWLYDNQVTVSWCGDSRAYLYRDSEGIRQISKDHSYVQGLVDEGKITEEEAFDHPYGNIITRSLGDPEKKAEPDSVTIPVYKRDVILVCSDGLSGVLRDRKSYDREGNLLPGLNLEDIIRENKETMTGCREALWSAAESSDWYDNVTAILCEVVEGAELPVGKTDDAASNNPTSGSFIHFKIRKKSLKAVAYVIAAACLCCLAVFFGKRFLTPKPDPEVERFLHQRDSLIKVADSLGIVILKDQISSMPDSVDFDGLNQFEHELKQRNGLMQRLSGLHERAQDFGFDGVAHFINAQIDVVKSAPTVEVPLSDIEESLATGERLLNEIDKALENKAPFIAVKHQRITVFRESILQKEVIGEEEVRQWEEIMRERTFGALMQGKNPPTNPDDNLTEVPALT